MFDVSKRRARRSIRAPARGGELPRHGSQPRRLNGKTEREESDDEERDRLTVLNPVYRYKRRLYRSAIISILRGRAGGRRGLDRQEEREARRSLAASRRYIREGAPRGATMVLRLASELNGRTSLVNISVLCY